jgi:pimeloyl-ACP methyl ester carboxylesterase
VASTVTNRYRAALASVFLAACAGAHPAPQGGERMLYVEGGAGRLRVSDGGAPGGVPVVFLHGLGSDLECWRAQLDHLRASRRAIAYDARGHGGSERARDGVYTIDALTDDLERVVAQLGIGRFWLVGHSFSGTVVTNYAARHPERVAGLVYVDAVGDASSAPQDVKEYFRRKDADMSPAKLQQAYGEMLGPLARPATREHIFAAAARLDLPAFAALRSQLGDFHGAEALARYPGPKFAIEAEGSPNAAAASRLAGVRRRTIANVSHWLMMDDPDALDAALDDVLG